VLDYIRANVTDQCDENQAAAERIRAQLKRYEAKLKDLERKLKEAGDNVKKANAQNGLNTKALNNLLVMLHTISSLIMIIIIDD